MKRVYRMPLERHLGDWTAPLEPQHSLFQKQLQHDLMSRSALLKSAGEGKPYPSESSASVKGPLQQQQQQPQQHKRSKKDWVPDEFLQLAVYFEKFEKNELVKMSGKEFDMIKVGIVNAYVF